MAYSLGIDYSKIEDLKRRYRAEYGVDPPASLIRQWVAQETASGYESHLGEARSAAQREESRRGLGLGKGELTLGEKRLGLLKKQYEMENERYGAEATASKIQLAGTAIRAAPTLYEFGKGLLPSATVATPQLTTPALGSSLATPAPALTGLSQITPSAPLMAEASALAPQGGATGLGAALPVAGWAGLGAFGGGMVGQQIGGNTGKTVGGIAGGAAAGAIAGSPTVIGAPVGAVIGGIIGALQSLF